MSRECNKINISLRGNYKIIMERMKNKSIETTSNTDTNNDSIESKNTIIYYDVSVEAGILGAILIDNNNYHKIANILNEDCFYLSQHKAMYDGIVYLANRNMIINPSSLKIILKQTIGDDAEGLNNYLSSLTSDLQIMFNIEQHVRYLIELSQKRTLISISDQIQAHLNDPQKDAAVIAQLYQRKLSKITDNQSKSFTIQQAYEKRIAAILDSNISAVIPTGFKALDRMIGGFKNGHLTIIAGRPSMGKTAISLNALIATAESLTKEDKAAVYISLEMSEGDIVERLLTKDTGISSNKIASLKLNDYEKIILMNEVKKPKLNIIINDDDKVNFEGLKNNIMKIKRTTKIGIVFIDALQKINVTNDTSTIRTYQIAEITGGLKSLAKELDIPIILLAQLNREVEKTTGRDVARRPILSDLRDSGSVEQDADLVLLLHRDAYYLKNKEPKEGTEIHLQWQQQMEECYKHANILVAKNRNGSLGTVNLFFDPERMSFYEDDRFASYED